MAAFEIIPGLHQIGNRLRLIIHTLVRVNNQIRLNTTKSMYSATYIIHYRIVFNSNSLMGVWEEFIMEKIAPKRGYVESMFVKNHRIVFYTSL